jgi:hypothetical protein
MRALLSKPFLDEYGQREGFRAFFSDVDVRRQTVVMDHCADPLEFREYWKRNYGPTIAAYRFNADRPDCVEALDRDFLSFLSNWNRGGPDIAVYNAEYLLVTATKT